MSSVDFLHYFLFSASLFVFSSMCIVHFMCVVVLLGTLAMSISSPFCGHATVCFGLLAFLGDGTHIITSNSYFIDV